MNYRSLLLLLVFLTVATGTLAALDASARRQPVTPVAVSPNLLQIEDEEYAVYSALINADLKESEGRRRDAGERLLIINDSPSLWQGFLEDESKTFFDELKNSSPNLQPETVNDLQVKSQNDTSRLEPKLSIKIKYLLVKDEELDALFKDNVMGGWEAFERKYPKSSGFLTFSRVGFNSDKSQALVYKSWSCGGLCGGGGYILLTKKKGVWVVGPGVGPTWVS
ncbi:MAG TPA: hypothetical protein VF543_10000 [Pyrinomonadaceae bacterium]|jgi:hypothetical protein